MGGPEDGRGIEEAEGRGGVGGSRQPWVGAPLCCAPPHRVTFMWGGVVGLGPPRHPLCAARMPAHCPGTEQQGSNCACGPLDNMTSTMDQLSKAVGRLGGSNGGGNIPGGPSAWGLPGGRPPSSASVFSGVTDSVLGNGESAMRAIRPPLGLAHGGPVSAPKKAKGLWIGVGVVGGIIVLALAAWIVVSVINKRRAAAVKSRLITLEDSEALAREVAARRAAGGLIGGSGASGALGFDETKAPDMEPGPMPGVRPGAAKPAAPPPAPDQGAVDDLAGSVLLARRQRGAPRRNEPASAVSAGAPSLPGPPAPVGPVAPLGPSGPSGPSSAPLAPAPTTQSPSPQAAGSEPIIVGVIPPPPPPPQYAAAPVPPMHPAPFQVTTATAYGVSTAGQAEPMGPQGPMGAQTGLAAPPYQPQPQLQPQAPFQYPQQQLPQYQTQAPVPTPQDAFFAQVQALDTDFQIMHQAISNIIAEDMEGEEEEGPVPAAGLDAATQVQGVTTTATTATSQQAPTVPDATQAVQPEAALSSEQPAATWVLQEPASIGDVD